MEAFDRIVEHLERHAARFRVLRHAAEGRSLDVAAVRGTEVAQGAKALVCRVKGTESGALLAVVPGDARLDIRKAVTAVGGRNAGAGPRADRLRDRDDSAVRDRGADGRGRRRGVRRGP